jgi:hyperosmotically inducible periplasmic protein
MMRQHILPGALLIVASAFLTGCSMRSTLPDVSNQIRNSLDQAGLKDVSVSEDANKGVITLTGTAPSDGGKGQAELIAKTAAPEAIVSNKIIVAPQGDEGQAKKINSDLDKGIEKNLDAELIRHRLNKTVKYDVKNGVVTLSGKVRSESQRDDAEQLAKGVPNVQQVINQLEVKNQRASSSEKTGDV